MDMATATPMFVAILWNAVKMHWLKMRTAFGRTRTELGEDPTHLMCIGNQSRVINGQDIPPASLYDRQGAGR